MKIAVVGFSGSGKSTLARRLGEAYGLEVLHFDRIQFLPEWQVRDADEKLRLTREFMDSHEGWVMDGNYSKLLLERRLEEADRIIVMRFSAASCLLRVIRRYRKYRNTTRPDMAEGCRETLDAGFVKWILWKGRGKSETGKLDTLLAKYPEKTVWLRNQRDLDRFLTENNL